MERRTQDGAAATGGRGGSCAGGQGRAERLYGGERSGARPRESCAFKTRNERQHHLTTIVHQGLGEGVVERNFTKGKRPMAITAKNYSKCDGGCGLLIEPGQQMEPISLGEGKWHGVHVGCMDAYKKGLAEAKRKATAPLLPPPRFDHGDWTAEEWQRDFERATVAEAKQQLARGQLTSRWIPGYLAEGKLEGVRGELGALLGGSARGETRATSAAVGGPPVLAGRGAEAGSRSAGPLRRLDPQRALDVESRSPSSRGATSYRP
jgi:hypothetical protein